ncbi:uncharacterized protein ACHE_50099S [Aspergillus chevalieri]|uniref:Dextranase n=1 Tax=Aspergillus chevalieri TaxID=182096 RepID=A0A7R7VQF7_ASPCH|nr:uncharacterized protein ACHE_50099S [Aspergillus chevalieri]BCR88901.1 hypothetical protein ACHE_50099S [Aspergillus chevalieri]
MTFTALFLALCAFPIRAVGGASAIPQQANPSANPHCGSDFCTWWHDTAEVNIHSAVRPENVRQSRRYLVQVAAAGTNDFFDSFVYETIPRNGNGNVMRPGDSPASNTFNGTDGISIELEAGINMAWSHFEHGKDVDVKISRRDGNPVDQNVILRPAAIPYDLKHSDGSVIIRVPADPNGHRFSVEFDEDLFTYRSDGQGYTTHGEGDIVGVEPRNALLIFASPFLSEDLIPPMDGSDTKVMKPGPITVEDIEASPIVYFPPGVYYVNSDPIGKAHLKLDPSTYWVHLAPGAYVKGAVEYTTPRKDFYATGHGVLSGEIYVYQANVEKKYFNIKDDVTSLRMWWHRNIQGGQTWHCIGPTTNAPPFNSMDLKDGATDRDDISVEISDYKQVGAFFTQTDGPQMYTNGTIHDVFYHVNDDGIKTYHSGVNATRLTIWKVFNDPIIQMGWTPRDVHGISIDTLYIIHTRYQWSDTYVPTSIIGASPSYLNDREVDSSKSMSMSLSNISCEGLCPALFRLTPLQNYVNFTVSGVSMPDGLIGGDVHTGDSIIATTPATTYPGLEDLKMDLRISDWTVKGNKVTTQNAATLGQFHINKAYAGQWSIS